MLSETNLHPTKRPDVENHRGRNAGFTTRLTNSLTTVGLNLLGATMMITPLALWVAWTETVLYVVLATGVMAGVLYCLLALYEERADSARREPATNLPAATVPDAFVAELHALFPLTYHHRRLGDPAFQRKMDRLKRLLRS